jgi:hypothetical protein
MTSCHYETLNLLKRRTWHFQRMRNKPCGVRSDGSVTALSFQTEVHIPLFLGFHNGGICLKLHTPHFPRLRNKPCKTGSDRTVIMDTLLGRENFSAVSRRPLGRFSLNDIQDTFNAFATNHVSLVPIGQ